jgi:hypothetical protein
MPPRGFGKDDPSRRRLAGLEKAPAQAQHPIAVMAVAAQNV